MLLTACSSDEEISIKPEISFVSIDPVILVSGEGSVTIRISYFDSDGDLGENDANVKNLFVTDSRNNVRFSFRIPALAPEGESIAIRGELPIIISNVALIGTGLSDETVQYTVSVTDRAGNSSNTIETTPITITSE